jgi:hypothetical protein
MVKLLEVPAALARMAMSTYTGALLSATSTPLWAAASRRIATLFGASAMASGAAALTIAEQGRGASDTGRPLDRIALVASALELFLLLSLRQRFREQGVDGAPNETGWGLAYDFGAVALGAGVPMLHHIESVIEPERAPRRTLTISLAVLAGRVPVAPRAAARRQHLGKAAQGLFSSDRKGAAVSPDCCRAAVETLDRALDDGPDKIYHDLARRPSGAVQCHTEHGHWRRVSTSRTPPRPLA